MLNIGICGADGKMGLTLLRLVHRASDMRATVAIVEATSPMLAKDIAPLSGGDRPLTCTSQIDPRGCDVLIDFSHPDATVGCLQECTKHQTSLVIGTTGHSEQQTDMIKQAAKRIPIFWAANMSWGIHVCGELARHAVQRLGEDYDIEIAEGHHKHKKDAPSGTALMLGRLLAAARGQTLEKRAVYDRRQADGRTKGEIGFQVTRGGDLVGEHSVRFIGEGEVVEIRHQANSRVLFARGALRAATWLAGQDRAGLYAMSDLV